MSDICVVHLVWDQLDIEHFKSFISSYQQYDSGLDHDLAIIFQGNFQENIDRYFYIVEDIKYNSIFRKNIGFDIGAYLDISKKYAHNYFFYLNSYSRILDHQWLSKMYHHVKRDDVGIVGATGSYESPFSLTLSAKPRTKPFLRKILSKFWKKYLQFYFGYYYDPFPNYHIRTNAFIISRELFLEVGKKYNFNKRSSTLLFESGKEGLSKMILERGLKLLVVGKNGLAYEKEEWHMSHTFRQGNQENLLIADNRTDEYNKGNFDKKMSLAKASWGHLTNMNCIQ